MGLAARTIFFLITVSTIKEAKLIPDLHMRLPPICQKEGTCSVMLNARVSLLPVPHLLISGERICSSLLENAKEFFV